MALEDQPGAMLLTCFLPLNPRAKSHPVAVGSGKQDGEDYSVLRRGGAVSPFGLLGTWPDQRGGLSCNYRKAPSMVVVSCQSDTRASSITKTIAETPRP